MSQPRRTHGPVLIDQTAISQAGSKSTASAGQRRAQAMAESPHHRRLRLA